MPGQFGVIRGDTGTIKVGPGTGGIIKSWVVKPVGTKPDGTPRLQFKCQFSWMSEAILNLNMAKRVQVQVQTKYGQENIDILAWDDWRLDGGVLTLENILHFEGVRLR